MNLSIASTVSGSHLLKVRSMLEFQNFLIFFGAASAIVLGLHVMRPIKATNPFGA